MSGAGKEETPTLIGGSVRSVQDQGGSISSSRSPSKSNVKKKDSQNKDYTSVNELVEEGALVQDQEYDELLDESGKLRPSVSQTGTPDVGNDKQKSKSKRKPPKEPTEDGPLVNEISLEDLIDSQIASMSELSTDFQKRINDKRTKPRALDSSRSRSSRRKSQLPGSVIENDSLHQVPAGAPEGSDSPLVKSRSTSTAPKEKSDSKTTFERPNLAGGESYRGINSEYRPGRKAVRDDTPTSLAQTSEDYLRSVSRSRSLVADDQPDNNELYEEGALVHDPEHSHELDVARDDAIDKLTDKPSKSKAVADVTKDEVNEQKKVPNKDKQNVDDAKERLRKLSQNMHSKSRRSSPNTSRVSSNSNNVDEGGEKSKLRNEVLDDEIRVMSEDLEIEADNLETKADDDEDADIDDSVVIVDERTIPSPKSLENADLEVKKKVEPKIPKESIRVDKPATNPASIKIDRSAEDVEDLDKEAVDEKILGQSEKSSKDIGKSTPTELEKSAKKSHVKGTQEEDTSGSKALDISTTNSTDTKEVSLDESNKEETKTLETQSGDQAEVPSDLTNLADGKGANDESEEVKSTEKVDKSDCVKDEVVKAEAKQAAKEDKLVVEHGVSKEVKDESTLQQQKEVVNSFDEQVDNNVGVEEAEALKVESEIQASSDAAKDSESKSLDAKPEAKSNTKAELADLPKDDTSKTDQIAKGEVEQELKDITQDRKAILPDTNANQVAKKKAEEDVKDSSKDAQVPVLGTKVEPTAKEEAEQEIKDITKDEKAILPNAKSNQAAKEDAQKDSKDISEDEGVATPKTDYDQADPATSTTVSDEIAKEEVEHELKDITKDNRAAISTSQAESTIPSTTVSDDKKELKEETKNILKDENATLSELTKDTEDRKDDDGKTEDVASESKVDAKIGKASSEGAVEESRDDEKEVEEDTKDEDEGNDKVDEANTSVTEAITKGVEALSLRSKVTKPKSSDDKKPESDAEDKVASVGDEDLKEESEAPEVPKVADPATEAERLINELEDAIEGDVSSDSIANDAVKKEETSKSEESTKVDEDVEKVLKNIVPETKEESDEKAKDLGHISEKDKSTSEVNVVKEEPKKAEAEVEPTETSKEAPSNDIELDHEPTREEIIELLKDEPVYLYTSLAGGGFHMPHRTNRLATILTGNEIPFKYRDLGTDEEARNVWRRYGRGRLLPAVVRGKDDIIGNFQEIDEANEEYRVRELVYETL